MFCSSFQYNTVWKIELFHKYGNISVLATRGRKNISPKMVLGALRKFQYTFHMYYVHPPWNLHFTFACLQKSGAMPGKFYFIPFRHLWGPPNYTGPGILTQTHFYWGIRSPLMKGKNNCAKIQGRSGAMTKPSWEYSVCLLIQQFLAALRTP